MAEFRGNPPDHRTGHAIQQQIRLQALEVFHQQTGGLFVSGQVHVERAVGLDVLQGHTLNPGKLTQGAQLIEHVVDQLLGRRIDVSTAKTNQVAKPRMRADGHAQALGLLDGAAHGARVAGMKTGGDVGRTDKAHQLIVDAIADGPGAKAFAHVRVEIYCLHDACSRRL
ncbi:hypothetical protein D3C84_851910 [compost metagenome]